MKTEKAIKFLNCRDRHLLYGQPTQYASELNEAIDHIVKVAQQNDKFKKMWSEVMRYVFYNDKGQSIVESYHMDKVSDSLNDLKQKYFPEKESK